MPGPWSERLPHFRLDSAPSVGGDELQTEYFVGRRHAVPALRALRSLGEQIAPHLHAAEIRTVAADQLWLSPAFERDSLCIGFTWRNHPAEVGRAAAGHRGRAGAVRAAAALGQALPAFGRDELAGGSRGCGDFAELVRQYDPAGKF